MKRRVTMFVAAVGLAGLLGASPAGAVGTCPDNHMMFPVTTERDAEKDNNGNFVVCKKVNSQGQVIGGPDDVHDDIV